MHIQGLILESSSWGNTTLKRHNDAAHSLYKISTLADFGLMYGDDPKLDNVIELILSRQSVDGAFQTVVNIPKAFGGTNQDLWTWILCDSPTLLYSLLSFGLENDLRIQHATGHLINLVDDNGWSGS